VAPCVIFEDEHLLVVNKPAGLNTHSPAPYAGEGIYDWLRDREPRWSQLAIIHRLDKETSGILIFSKSPLGNRSLTGQFAGRQVQKRYLLLTDRSAPKKDLIVASVIVRAGDRYVSRPPGPAAPDAETAFHVLPGKASLGSATGLTQVEARPLTGKTHQIRVHAQQSGFPILGDTLYGGTQAPRLCLHALEITIRHPATGEERTFRAPCDFGAPAADALRESLIAPDQTNACRLIHGAPDRWPGWHVDRLGNFLLSESASPLRPDQRVELERLACRHRSAAAYHKILNRHVRRATTEASAARLVFGEPAPDRFQILENGARYELSFNEGYSVGLFLDQRENRRRLLRGHAGREFSLPPAARVLNAFAYTCGFSVCAARAGGEVTSLDLSRKYLEWGRRNFVLNQLDPAAHHFIYGDVFDWFRRLARKGAAFDLILLDPPTFSRSREHGTFQVEKDYGALCVAALKLLKPGGVLFASTNSADWAAEAFLGVIEKAVAAEKRKIVRSHYVPQPPDFPITKEAPAYLKTVWLKID
jgi:23S rRNA (cytosine1962-C5)-methyltransferase